MSSKLESDVCCRLQVAPSGESYGGNRRPGKNNGSLLPGLWHDSLHVTCGLTACTLGSAPGPTTNEYGKTLPLPFYVSRIVGCKRRSGVAQAVHRDFYSVVFGPNSVISICCGFVLDTTIRQIHTTNRGSGVRALSTDI